MTFSSHNRSTEREMHMQTSSRSNFFCGAGQFFAHAVIEGRKDAQATKHKQAEAEAAKKAQSEAAKASAEATQTATAVPAAADSLEAAPVPTAAQKGAEIGTAPGAAAALAQPPTQPTTFNEAVFHVAKAGTKYAIELLLQWAGNGEGANDASAFADRLDMARTHLPQLGKREADAVMARLTATKSSALREATPEQQKTVQVKWDTCVETYQKRLAQLDAQTRVPVEPSSSMNRGSRITAAQADAIFPVLLKTPYCNAQTRKVLRKPESAKALLAAYKQAGGTQMTEKQAGSVRSAMSVIQRGDQPLQAAHLKTGE